MAQARKNISKETIKNIYTDLDAYEIFSVSRSSLTANAWNTIYATFGAISASQCDNTNAITLALDSNGTNTAGDVLGQVFIAPDTNNNGISNIHHVCFWGSTTNTTDNLQFRLVAPSAYSSSGVPTFDFSTNHYYLDVTNDVEAKNATAQSVTIAGTSFSGTAVVQRLSVPLRYASHRTAMTTISTAADADDIYFEVANNANAIDNHNDVTGSDAKGEMVVVRKLSGEDSNGKSLAGREYRYMIRRIAGNNIYIVPNVYDAIGRANLGIDIAVGDEVYFPLTTGNAYALVWYLNMAGGAPVSAFTFYGRNNYPTYPNITNTIGVSTGAGNLLSSTTGYNNLVRVGSNYNAFFEIYSTPAEWAIDDITIYSTNSNLLTGMMFEVARQTNMFREGTMLLDRTTAPYNGISMSLDIGKSNITPKNNIGDFINLSAFLNASTTINMTIGVYYRPFFQNNELYVERGRN